MNILRRVFWFLNKFFMVPLFRLGLGVFIVNPLTGYIMTLKTKGRKTSKTRYTPVNLLSLGSGHQCWVNTIRKCTSRS